MKAVVTISRYWDNPKITTVITPAFISLSIDMEDFVTALKQEIGSVTWTFKKETFDKQLDEAIRVVLEKVKEESIKVV